MTGQYAISHVTGPSHMEACLKHVLTGPSHMEACLKHVFFLGWVALVKFPWTLVSVYVSH